MSTIKLLDISYVFKDYAEKNNATETLFKFLALMQTEIYYYVKNIVYWIRFHLKNSWFARC